MNMGKIKDLDIRYDHPSIYAGTMLRGQVCFYLKEPCQRLNGVISLRVEGQTRVSLPGDPVTHDRWLLSTELNLTAYADQRMNVGFHQIPFAYPIAHNLPSSYGDKLGYVHYCCKISVNGQHKLQKPFNVIGIEDLNWHPYAALPVSVKECASAPFWAFNKSAYNVNVLLQLERTGFIPGEIIYINAEISNQSKRKVKQSSVQLKQGVLYKSPNGGRQKEIFKVIENVCRGSIPPGSIDQWEQEPLQIPFLLPPSFLRGSEMISVKYELLFTVDPGVTMVIPLILGTIPFHPENMKRIMKALPWKEQNNSTAKQKQQRYHSNDQDSDSDFENNQQGSYSRGSSRYCNAVVEKSCIKIEEIID